MIWTSRRVRIRTVVQGAWETARCVLFHFMAEYPDTELLSGISDPRKDAEVRDILDNLFRNIARTNNPIWKRASIHRCPRCGRLAVVQIGPEQP